MRLMVYFANLLQYAASASQIAETAVYKLLIQNGMQCTMVRVLLPYVLTDGSGWHSTICKIHPLTGDNADVGYKW